jgi:hypothetical protein
MTTFRSSILIALLSASPLALAQQKAPAAIGFPDAPGKDVLLKKCFQCHTPGMWMDHRQDRRGWEGTLYRMVGRGALWNEDEIRAMADYLGKVYGK